MDDRAYSPRCPLLKFWLACVGLAYATGPAVSEETGHLVYLRCCVVECPTLQSAQTDGIVVLHRLDSSKDASTVLLLELCAVASAPTTDVLSRTLLIVVGTLPLRQEPMG